MSRQQIKLRRVSLARFLAVSGVLVLGACFSGGGSSQRPCQVLTPNATWQSINFNPILSEPRRCPYVVRSPGDSAQYAIDVRGPALYGGTGAPFGSPGKLTVVNALGQPASADNTQYYTLYPYNNDTGYVLFTGKFAAGISGAGGALPRDSVTMTFFSWFVPQNSVASLILPGRLDSAKAQSLVGPSSVGPGLSGSWSASVPGDTISYAYAWKIDGQSVGGASGNILGTSWQTVGSHVLSVTTTRSDYSTTVSSLTVSVVFNSSISGKSTTKRPCDLTYTSSVTGGVGSLTRVWKLDGATVQTGGASLDLTVDWLGAKTLSTQITDSVGNVSNASFTITGTSTGTCTL